MKIRKYLFALLAGCAAWTALPAQNKLLDSPSRKLQLAEFAISNLYVDKVDEDKLVETAIVSMLEERDLRLFRYRPPACILRVRWVVSATG